jgi:hypothetical protein
MKKLYSLFLLSLVFASVSAQPIIPQPIDMPKVPMIRALSHDNIHNAQKTIMQLDGVNDSLFAPSKNADVNKQLTSILIVVVNNMAAKVELNKDITDNNKFKWLRGINDMLTSFISAYKAKLVSGLLLGDLIMGYDESMGLELKGLSIQPVIEKNKLEVGNILIQNFALKNNVGIPGCKDALMLKSCYRYPARVMNILSTNPNVYFADSIIKSLAYNDPEQLYNYAAAPDLLGRKIQSSNDTLTKTIGLLALMKTGRMYFPFLDDIYHHKLSLDSLVKIVNDSTAYFKLLVRTQIEYADRMQHGDTPLVMQTLTNKLRSKAIDNYIFEINSLHDENNESIRFKKLEVLSPQDLYYVAVLGEAEIYTSSYLGVYKRIFAKMKTPSADTLLNWVHYDYYKKFVKIAANYNTLDDFLKRMTKTNSEKLMRDFVSGLEKNRTLEDAVDVADSYGSISNLEIKKWITEQIGLNLEQSEKDNNKRGQTIYNLLNIIFMSMDSSKEVNLVARLGIDGVYEMPIRKLQDSTGRVIIQQFFYGDKDGNGVYKSFLTHYRDSKWKIVDKPQWTEVISTRGTPITIYCNKPFDNEQDLDAKSQKELGRYLEENSIYPTVVIHRGHSYFVKYTIEQLPSSAKVILLGSCGGYQSINDVLETCPSAHIIASKQVGTGLVNIGLINIITETLRTGRSLDWPLIWKNMAATLVKDQKMTDRFDDYVPPYKNLGAIFIMAYNKQMEE